MQNAEKVHMTQINVVATHTKRADPGSSGRKYRHVQGIGSVCGTDCPGQSAQNPGFSDRIHVFLHLCQGYDIL